MADYEHKHSAQYPEEVELNDRVRQLEAEFEEWFDKRAGSDSESLREISISRFAAMAEFVPQDDTEDTIPAQTHFILNGYSRLVDRLGEQFDQSAATGRGVGAVLEDIALATTILRYGTSSQQGINVQEFHESRDYHRAQMKELSGLLFSVAGDESTVIRVGAYVEAHAKEYMRSRQHLLADIRLALHHEGYWPYEEQTMLASIADIEVVGGDSPNDSYQPQYGGAEVISEIDAADEHVKKLIRQTGSWVRPAMHT